MRIHKPLVSLFIALVTGVFAYASIDVNLQMQLGNPTSATSDPSNHAHYLIQRPQYAMDYNDTTREPNWVAWDLTSADIGSSGRSSFIVDTNLPISFYQVLTTDYSGSGYDRGHLCPSADRTVTVADNQQVFYMSNMMPQAPDNNQGVWANFEGYCRTLATAGNELLIIAGPGEFAGSAIASGVAIPGYTWKIVVVVPLGTGTAKDRIIAAGAAAIRVIAIRIPNIQGVRNDPWQNYIVSPSVIESKTGFTFFTDLPAAIASAFRAKVDGQTVTGAPSITTQPVSQTTAVGGSATFSVTATGDAPLTYQWLKDDVEIPGATDSTLSLTNVQATDAGNYYVVATNNVSSATSAVAALNISGLAPTITTPPGSETVAAGNSATFSVTVGGSAPFTYQWRKNASPISGATNVSLTLTNVQAADAASYDVVVTNTVGSITSGAATLTVTPTAPTITVQPVARSVSGGTTALFSVTATGSAPLTYQWRKNSVNLTDGAVVSGSTTATLTLSGVTSGDAGSYDVVVTNSLSSVTSTAAALTVNAATIYWDFTTATPTSGQPADITSGSVSQGNNNVSSGNPPLLSSTSVSSGYTGASGGNNAGIAARTGPLNQAANGSAYFEFSLTPVSGKKIQITGMSFGSRSTSTGPQAFAVYTNFDNYAAPVASGTLANNSSYALKTPAFSTVTGVLNSTVTVRIYGYLGAGSASAGTANWRIDDLKVNVNTLTATAPIAPAVTSVNPANGTNAVSVSSPITVTFNNPVNVGNAWFLITSATSGPVTATVTGGPTTYTLTPPASFAFGDTISVKIVATQVTDKDTGTLTLPADYVFSFSTGLPVAPSITTQPQSLIVSDAGSAAFSVVANGTAPLTYQWRYGGLPIAGNASATTPTLTLPVVTLGSAGSYDVVVTNAAGAVTSSAATLTVNLVAPTITVQPAPKVITFGGTGTLSVVANGSAPLNYAWRKNGVALVNGGTISGATTASLTLGGVTAADAGSYDVIVTNPVNSVTSNAVFVGITSATLGQVVWDFTTASPTTGLPADVSDGVVTQGNNNGTTALLTTTSASGSYAGASAGNNAGAAARVGALNQAAGGSVYFEFILTPAAGKQLIATALAFGSRSTGTGPLAYAVYTSVDNFTSTVATGTLANDSAWHLTTPAFAGVRGQPGLPVTFRIYGFNGAGSPGSGTANWRIDDMKLTVGTELPPAVVGTAPSAGATGAALNSSIVVTFNQAVNVTGSWYAVTSAANGAVPVTVSGGPTTFTLTPGAAFDAGDSIATTLIAARVTDQTGTLGMASNYAFTFATAVRPSIIVQPQPQTVTVGNDTAFSVTADGTAPLSYQWKKNGVVIAGNPSATTATLMLAGVTSVDTGAYSCVVTNLAGLAVSDTASLTVNKAPAVVVLSSLGATYDGSAKPATVTTAPANLNVTITYDGSATAPTNAGNYAVSATINDPNYLGSAIGTLVINKAPATISLSNLAAIYDGTAKSVTATTSPANLAVALTYNAAATAPTNAGSYAVAAAITDPNYTGNASGTLAIAKATPTVTWPAPAAITYGTALGATQLNATASTAGTFAYTPAAGTILNAGVNQTLSAVFTPADTVNYTAASIATTLTVNVAPATIALGSLTQTYDGTAKSVTTTTTPAGLPVVVTYDGSPATPAAAGSYAVVATINSANYTGSASGTLTIAKATATIVLDPLAQNYDGTAKSVTATTTPAGLTVTLTYDGAVTAPIYPGPHAVVATIDDPNYSGTASGTLTIAITALVRHAPTLNGIVDGSMQVLNAESLTLNSGASLSGDLLVLGTPIVQLNGHPTIVGTKDGPGAATPAGYTVTLNSNAVLRYLVRHVDAIALPIVSAPPAPTGTRSVTLNKSTDTAGDFATLRDLTLNGNAGTVVIPAGTYGAVSANGNSNLVLGVAGATTPAVYNFQSLTLNGNATLQIAGPVVLTLANGLTLNANVGAAAHPEWLVVNVANGGVTLNGGATLNAIVVAPSGTVTVNGNATLRGQVSSDRLTLNGNALLDGTP